MRLQRCDGPVTKSGRIGPATWCVYPFMSSFAWNVRREGRDDRRGGVCFGKDAEAQAVAKADDAARVMAGKEARDE